MTVRPPARAAASAGDEHAAVNDRKFGALVRYAAPPGPPPTDMPRHADDPAGPGRTP